MSKKILIVGASGLVGSEILKNLKSTNNDLILLSRRKLLDENNISQIIIDFENIDSLSADTEIDEILGLELGADDFLVKPVSMNKLLARIKSNIRKKIEVVDNNISWGPIEINKNTRSVYINSVKIMFTKTEFDILYLLMSKEGKVFKRIKY